MAQDEKQAVVWYRKAAEQGGAQAQCSLGVMYREGLGVSRDAKCKAGSGVLQKGGRSGACKHTG